MFNSTTNSSGALLGQAPDTFAAGSTSTASLTPPQTPVGAMTPGLGAPTGGSSVPLGTQPFDSMKYSDIAKLFGDADLTTIQSAADDMDTFSKTLTDHAGYLDDSMAAVSGYWQGPAADAFTSAMNRFSQHVRDVADTAKSGFWAALGNTSDQIDWAQKNLAACQAVDSAEVAASKGASGAYNGGHYSTDGQLLSPGQGSGPAGAALARQNALDGGDTLAARNIASQVQNNLNQVQAALPQAPQPVYPVAGAPGSGAPLVGGLGGQPGIDPATAAAGAGVPGYDPNLGAGGGGFPGYDPNLGAAGATAPYGPGLAPPLTGPAASGLVGPGPGAQPVFNPGTAPAGLGAPGVDPNLGGLGTSSSFDPGTAPGLSGTGTGSAFTPSPQPVPALGPEPATDPGTSVAGLGVMPLPAVGPGGAHAVGTAPPVTGIGPQPTFDPGSDPALGAGIGLPGAPGLAGQPAAVGFDPGAAPPLLADPSVAAIGAGGYGLGKTPGLVVGGSRSPGGLLVGRAPSQAGVDPAAATSATSAPGLAAAGDAPAAEAGQAAAAEGAVAEEGAVAPGTGGGMPMTPYGMGGAAGGRSAAGERGRQAWLNEDDDLWGAPEGLPPNIIGGRPSGGPQGGPHPTAHLHERSERPSRGGPDIRPVQPAQHHRRQPGTPRTPRTVPGRALPGREGSPGRVAHRRWRRRHGSRGTAQGVGGLRIGGPGTQGRGGEAAERTAAGVTGCPLGRGQHRQELRER
jgi:uncharacterized protein YukE